MTGTLFTRLDKILSADAIIADVGAADGEDTIRYALSYPRAQIHAFEPMPFNVEQIVEAVSMAGINRRVRIYPVALADVDTEAPFWRSGGVPQGWTGPLGPDGWIYSGSLLPPKLHLGAHPWCTFREGEAVTVRRLDTLAAERQILRIDFMHLDVQGAELRVLAGAGRLLETVRAVWLEVARVELYAGQPLYDDVRAFMQAAGFRLEIDTAAAQPWGDQLWVR